MKLVKKQQGGALNRAHVIAHLPNCNEMGTERKSHDTHDDRKLLYGECKSRVALFKD